MNRTTNQTTTHRSASRILSRTALRRSPAWLLATTLLLTLSPTAMAAAISWDGADGTNPTYWDILTTANWNGSTTTYTDGDDVTFDDSATAATVDVRTTVSPTSMVISSSVDTYFFNNTLGTGDIAGGTSIIKSGSTLATFNQPSLSFTGGTQINSTGGIQYNASGAGPHSFGTGTIVLNNSGAEFIYNPTVASSSLTNDFEINADVLWRQAQNGGTRTGTVTVNSNFRFPTNGSGPGTMEADMVLTGNTQITGGRFGSNFSTISGNVTSSGGPHDITIRHIGQNPDWRYIVGQSLTSTPWDVQNFIRTSGGPTTQRSGTLQFDVDERDFFDLVEANGGQVTLEGSIQFLRSNTVEVGFNLIVNENNSTNNTGGTFIGTGFRNNDQLNIVTGGLLGGDGTIRHRDGLGAAGHPDPVDVDVFTGGQISPGDATLADTTDILTIQGDLTFLGGQLTIDVTGGGAVAGVDYDQLVVADSDTPAGRGNASGFSSADLVVDFSGVTLAELDGDVLTILLSENDLTGLNFNSVQSTGIENLVFDVTFGNGFIQLSNFDVPEPGSAMLVGLGLFALTFHVRHRRQSSRRRAA